MEGTGTAFVFAVVEFLDESSVSVVHKSWIESSGQGIYCYWPPTSANISSKVRKGEIPDKSTWAKYKIRIFNYTDHSRKGKRPHSKKVQQKSKVRSASDDSDDDDAPIKTKLRFPDPPVVGAWSSPPINQVMEGDVVDRTPTPTPSSSSSTTCSTSIRSEEEPTRTLGILRIPELPVNDCLSPPLNLESVLDRTPTPTPTRRSDNSFQVVVLQKLNAVIENQKAIASAIKQIGSSGTGRAGGSSIIEDLLPEPFKKIDEMERLRESLTDDQYKKKMVLFLTSQGGHDHADCLRRIMKKIGTNRLWAEYSLRGQKKKKAFEQHPICKIAMKCCLKNYPKAKISEMEEVLIDFLKQAPHKKGGPKYKEPKTPRMQRTTLTLSDSD